MIAVARAATAAHDKTQDGSLAEAYYGGFLHCWGLVTELERPRPDTIQVSLAMQQLGFPDAVIAAVVGFLEGAEWTQKRP